MPAVPVIKGGWIFDHHAPLKSRSFVERPLVPRMTNDILLAKQEKKRAEKKWHKTHLEVHRQIYQSERDNVRKIIQNAKTSHYQGAVENCEGDQAKLFKFVNSLFEARIHQSYLITHLYRN
jgi:hypothetical protein